MTRKDMRRLNSTSMKQNHLGEWFVFGKVGSGKNSYVVTLAFSKDENEIHNAKRVIDGIVSSYNTPIAIDVIREIRTRKGLYHGN